MMKRVFKYSILIIVCAVSASANSAEVRKITKKSVIATGAKPEDGLSKGEEACFYDAEDQEIGCGEIVRTTKAGKIIYIKAPRSVKRKLKKGFTVRLAGSGESGGGGATKGRLKIWALYGAALATPVTYNKLAYEAHINEAPTTLWEQGDPVKSTLVGFGFAVGIPLGNMSIIPGFRYRSFTSTLVASDLFIDSSPNRYVEVEQSASSMAVYTDVAYLNMKFGSLIDFFLTAGLDFDMSTVTFVATQKDDSATPLPDEEFGSAKSSLTLVGLRLGAHTDFMFANSFGMNFGLNIIVPLAKATGSFSGDVADSSATGLPDQKKDLEASLGHKKNSVGIEVALGVVLAL